jgi:hypothetical protein
MSLHIGSTVILFDLVLQRIFNDTEQLASRTRTLLQGKKYPSNYDRIDLRRSEQNLRDAADNIKAIREEIEGRREAYKDREADILDALSLGQIGKDEATKLLSELTADYHDARTLVREAEEVS